MWGIYDFLVTKADEPRTIKCAGRIVCWYVRSSPFIDERITSTDFWAISLIGAATVVSEGNTLAETSILSNPTTQISSGILNPFSWIIFITPMAIVSFAQIIAVGGSDNDRKYFLYLYYKNTKGSDDVQSYDEYYITWRRK